MSEWLRQAENKVTGEEMKNREAIYGKVHTDVAIHKNYERNTLERVSFT